MLCTKLEQEYKKICKETALAKADFLNFQWKISYKCIFFKPSNIRLNSLHENFVLKSKKLERVILVDNPMHS